MRCCNFSPDVIELESTSSTNDYLSKLCEENKAEEFLTVVSEFQTSGKGQRGNSWESERGKNLTFSTVAFPSNILARDQFIISMIASVSVCDVLSQYTDDISIKWPNDIYWKDKKICGMLIENDLQGMYVARTILGIGININQNRFVSSAPNPISLYQIVNKECDRGKILSGVLSHISKEFKKAKEDGAEYIQRINDKYKSLLYRRDGSYTFSDGKGLFVASIYNVEFDGHLILRDENECLRRYIFKEVKFII